jgi:type I restriction enzyme S subunit
VTTAWTPTRLGDVLRVKHGYAFSGMGENAAATLPVVVGIGNFDYAGGFRFSSTTRKRYNGKYPLEFELAPGDVLLAMTCQTPGGEILGIPGTIPDDGQVYLHNQRLGKIEVRDPKRIHVPFVFQLARWSVFNQHLFATASGSKILHTSPGRIEDFRFDLPPIDEQRAIAATLGALDDKIESNRRAAERATELIDAAASELLARTSTDVLPLSDLVEFNHLTVKPQSTGVLHYIDIASVSPGRVDSVRELTWDEAPSRARRGVTDGDVIYSTVRPGNRAFALILDPAPGSVASTGFAVMAPSLRIGSSLLTSVAGSMAFAEYLESVAHGSAYPAVSIEAMGNYPVVVPQDVVDVERFDADTMLLRRRVAQSQIESDRLAALRDAILPELLSGQVRALSEAGL